MSTEYKASAISTWMWSAAACGIQSQAQSKSKSNLQLNLKQNKCWQRKAMGAMEAMEAMEAMNTLNRSINISQADWLIDSATMAVNTPLS